MKTIEIVQEYGKKFIEIKEKHKIAVDYAKKNYIGAKLDSLMKQLSEEQTEAINDIKVDAVNEIQQDFESVRSTLKNIISRPASTDVENIILNSSKLTTAEKTIIFESHEKNYMDAKLLSSAFGLLFTTADNLFDELTDSENELEKFFSNSLGEYQWRNIASGHTLEDIDNQVTGFIDKYDVKGDETK